MFSERTSVGLDVHARSVVAAAIDGDTGELVTERLVPSNEGVVSWIKALPGPAAVTYEARRPGSVWLAHWQVEVEGHAPVSAAHVLPVPLPRERRNVPGALKHPRWAPVGHRPQRPPGVWRGTSELAPLERGALALAGAGLAARTAPPDGCRADLCVTAPELVGRSVALPLG